MADLLPVELRSSIWRFLCMGPIDTRLVWQNNRPTAISFDDGTRFTHLTREYHGIWLKELRYRDFVFETLKEAGFFLLFAADEIKVRIHHVKIKKACEENLGDSAYKRRALESGLVCLFEGLAELPNLESVTFAVGFCDPVLLPPIEDHLGWSSQLLDPRRQCYGLRERCCLNVFEILLLFLKPALIDLVRDNRSRQPQVTPLSINFLDAQPDIEPLRAHPPPLSITSSIAILQSFKRYLTKPFPANISGITLILTYPTFGVSDVPLSFQPLSEHPLEDTILSKVTQYYERPHGYQCPDLESSADPSPLARLESIFTQPYTHIWTPQEIVDMSALAVECNMFPKYIFIRMACSQAIRLLYGAMTILNNNLPYPTKETEKAEQHLAYLQTITIIMAHLRQSDISLRDYTQIQKNGLFKSETRLMDQFVHWFSYVQEDTSFLDKRISSRALYKAWVWTLQPCSFGRCIEDLRLMYEERLARMAPKKRSSRGKATSQSSSAKS